MKNHNETREPSLPEMAATYRTSRRGAKWVRSRWPRLAEPDWTAVGAEAQRQETISARRHGARAFSDRLEGLRRRLRTAIVRTANRREAAASAPGRLARRLLALSPGNTKSAAAWREVLAGSRDIEYAGRPLGRLAVDALAALLCRHGWARSHRSDSGSVYVERADWRLRLSTHDLPMHPEREHNWSHGRKCCNDEIVLPATSGLEDTSGAEHTASAWHHALRHIGEIHRKIKEEAACG